jgi:phosphate transport system substrate-binding protein
MRTAFRRALAASLVAAGTLTLGLLTACSSKSGPKTVTLNGAGSTFVNPVMSRWTQIFNGLHPNVRVNYQSIGSGGGVQQVKSGTVDFGASDYPLDDQALSQMKPVIQIPESAGPVCIIYTLPGLQKPLQLSSDVIAGIFLGKITSWHDAAVAKDNPGVKLPDTKIIPVHRTDGSGTTAAFTAYLSAVSDEWKSKVGKGGAVSWPGGVGGKGSEGVTEQVRQAPGSIGYVELTYAQQNKVPTAAVKNQAGHYVVPSLKSTTAAIDGYATELSKDPRTPIVNPPASAAEAYPISTLTFLIIPKDGTDATKRSALKEFATYMINLGQAEASTLNYAPLPDAVRQYDKQQLNQMTTNGVPIQSGL